MSSDSLERWLRALGYSAVPASLHRRGGPYPDEHRYGLEINELLRPEGQIRAHAVFDVEGTPTVCFLSADGALANDPKALDQIRQRIWNQNLVSVVLVLEGAKARAFSVQRDADRQSIPLALSDSSDRGAFSAAEFQSGDIQGRLPDWFRPEARVDRHLLENIGRAVTKLEDQKVSVSNAQYLMGQILFVAYLEHRGIISETYRDARKVGSLHALITERNVKGIVRLLRQLKSDFNGDFLRPDGDFHAVWDDLGVKCFAVLEDFLSHVDLDTGQRAFWNYDFSFLPVELLSGIYESFLRDQQANLGAYYTPRNLANLVVDQAFSGSTDILKEVVYDGACGSGILLTTAFRRMIGVAEARSGAQLALRDRIALLEAHIFGSDISETACRVTAFSLYLSLLERLQPADIVALRENEQVKLPRLLERNLFAGRKGDFFSPANPFASSRRFSLFVSNPPWREPKGDEVLTADKWAEQAGVPRARRQLAADFAHRALDSVQENGKLCMILPVSLLLAATSDSFVKGWLLRAQIDRVINLGDLQQLLFETASHSCVIVVARPRSRANDAVVPVAETFEYWVPKTDLSLAFGRLTLQSGDRHKVNAQAVWEDPGRLVTLMWGDGFDLSLWQRLRALGTFGAVLKGRAKRWVRRKGFHRIDRSRSPVSADRLRKMQFVPVDALRRDSPVLDPADLQRFPRDIESVAGLPDELLDVFRGPRILFPDGFSAEDRRIRAMFTSREASFSSSVGVLSGPHSDEDLLRFVAVYLRSELTSYFLLTHAYQVLTERNRVSLLDIERFPFSLPDDHPNPDLARTIVKQVAEISRAIEARPEVLTSQGPDSRLRKADELIYDYFRLDAVERAIVRESVVELLPAVRPRSYRKLLTRPQERSDLDQVDLYAGQLEAELESWRQHLGGNGKVRVRAVVTSLDRAGPWGIVKIVLQEGAEAVSSNRIEQGDEAVKLVLDQLRANKLLPMEMSGEWYFLPDAIIWGSREIYLIRPMKRRFWLRRTAIRDAQRIVESVQLHAGHQQKAA
jgi:hypothetical protein